MTHTRALPARQVLAGAGILAVLLGAPAASADQGHGHAAAAAPAASESAPQSAPQSAIAVDAGALYHDYCSVCHGDRGDGNSRARGSLQPPPRDFTAPEARALTRESMIAAVAYGRANTAMAPWKEQLSEGEIEALVDFIRGAFMKMDGETGVAAAGAADHGAALYARTCSVCHGDDGAGAVWASTNLNPRPRNFRNAAAARELSRERMIQAVTYGRPDTAMPGFTTQLSEQDIAAVVDHVRTRFMRLEVASAASGHATAPAAHGGADATHAAAAAGSHGPAAAAESAGHAAAAGHTSTAANAGHAAAGHEGAATPAPGPHDHASHADGPADHAAPFAGGLLGDASRGEALYRANCVACHGEQGNGQGPRAYFILPKPRNFLHPAARSTLNRPSLFEAIAWGSVGTEMPAWRTVLGPQEIADIAEYVLQRFVLEDGAASASAPAAVAGKGG